MKAIFIFVEGPTEENLTKAVLSPHLKQFNIHLNQFNCGGTIKYRSLLRKDILRQVNRSDIALVTTMFDYYALPKAFPGKSNLPDGTCYDCVAHLEREFAADISHAKFLPNFLLHEFEALLFSAPEEIAKSFPKKDESHELLKIKIAHRNNPEEIDDGPMTAPSKRIKKLYPDYDKRGLGTAIIRRIGLDVIRQECRHFNGWLTKLEAVGQAPT